MDLKAAAWSVGHEAPGYEPPAQVFGASSKSPPPLTSTSCSEVDDVDEDAEVSKDQLSLLTE